ncbi:MAG: hypothetical protein WAX67_12190 [Rugosibacter sp.]
MRQFNQINVCCAVTPPIGRTWAKSSRSAKRWDEGVGHLEREVFETFLSLPTAQRKIVREVILAFAKAQTVAEPDKKKPRG